MADGPTIMAVGDLVLGEPDPASFFGPSRDLLSSADVTIGHVEVPHTRHCDLEGRPGLPPERLDDLGAYGFDVATLAGNHVYDCGVLGIVDTVERLQAAGLATTGAGRDLTEAAAPAIVERSGTRIGVLSYNAVGPASSWATDAKGGCAYVHVVTHYELDYASPGATPTTHVMLEPTSTRRMADQVAALRDEVDVVVVAFHKGMVHVPAVVSDYESELARTAIDAGAAMVLGHHSHILRGVEMYRGAPIFHGLGNFVTVTRVLSARRARGDDDWAKRRLRLFGFEPDPEMPEYYAFHPDSRHTMVARCEVDPATGRVSAGFVPCWIDTEARPVPLARDEGGEDVVAYIRDISEQAGLSTTYTWDGSVVVVS